MKARALPQIAWALVVVGTFSAGRMLHTPPTSVSPAGILADAAAKAGERGFADDSESARHAQTDGLLDEQQAAERAHQAVSRAKEYERIDSACDLIPKITAENWRGVFETLGAMNDKEDPSLYTTASYHLIMEQIGKVAGADVLNEELAKPNWRRMTLRFVLSGWAEKDPKSAVAWYGQIVPNDQQVLIQGLVTGLARVDSGESRGIWRCRTSSFSRMMTRRPSFVRRFREGGARAGARSIDNLAGRKDLPPSVKGQIFGALAQVKVDKSAAAGKPLATLDWMEQYVGQEVMDSRATALILTKAALADPSKTLAWLQKNGARFTTDQQKEAFPAVARACLQKDPEQFAAWLTANPDDPQHDQFAATAAQRQLAAGNLDDAQRWLQLIGDPDLRAQFENTLRKRRGGDSGN